LTAKAIISVQIMDATKQNPSKARYHKIESDSADRPDLHDKLEQLLDDLDAHRVVPDWQKRRELARK
jgi:hypothetical protein